jgi:membrane associated rhomboid family serine protease
LLISHAVDENVLYGNTEAVAKWLSIILRINLMPIASDAYGKFQPYAMRAIAIITIAVTIGVWVINASDPQGEFGATRNLMLWAGDKPNPLLSLGAALSRGELGEFHYYQLLTNAFLHAGILHLAGNMVFFLVFANRVNALLGQWKAAVAYILLAILASMAFYLSRVGGTVIPALGASGAIMGMAGMYFVLMPLSRVYMVFWLRLGLLTGFRRWTKIFPVRGIWMLAFWIALQDILPTLLGVHDSTAHWAHLGGFISGVVLALLLLLTRQVDANGGDIISVTLGPAAWKILGTPAQRAKAFAA